MAFNTSVVYHFLKFKITAIKDDGSNRIINEHLISNSALDQILLELVEGNHWMAYNTTSYYLETHDIYLFNNIERIIDTFLREH
jgi:hypothetical protein